MPEASRSSERRRGRRAAVAFHVEERTNDALYFQRASLSPSGVWLEGTLPHPPGTRVELDLELPGGRTRVAGEVVGRDPESPGMAVRFVDLSDDSRARLEALVSRLCA